MAKKARKTEGITHAQIVDWMVGHRRGLKTMVRAARGRVSGNKLLAAWKEAKTMIKPKAGPALRIRGAHESGSPEAVNLTAVIVKRLEFLRDQWENDERHEVFRDPKTGEVYMVGTGEKAPPPKPAPAPKPAKRVEVEVKPETLKEMVITSGEVEPVEPTVRRKVAAKKEAPKADPASVRPTPEKPKLKRGSMSLD